MKIIPLISLSQLPADTDLFIYGSGRLGRVLRRALNLVGMAVAAFVDSKMVGDVDGLRRFSLDEFRTIPTSKLTLIIASSYFDEILPLVQTLSIDTCFDARPMLDFIGDIDVAVDESCVAELVKLGISKNSTLLRVVSETGLPTRAPTQVETSDLARALDPVLRPMIAGFVGGNDLTALLGKLIAAISEDVANPHLRHGFSGPLNGQQLRQMIFRRLDCLLGFDALVETGSFRGTTTEWLAGFGRPVYSCELDDGYFHFALARLARHRNVHLHRLDSRAFLSDFCRSNAREFDTPFFYLDAHWHQDLPLFDEIDIIADYFTKFIIMVDDFKSPFHSYGFDSYGPGLELTMECMYPRLRHRDKLCYLFPTLPPELETGARRGTLVVAPRELCDRIIGATQMLRPFIP